MQVKIFDINAKPVGEKQLPLEDFKLDQVTFARAVRVYEFALHQGTKKAKTRGELSYSNRKPWRQKGTGRARAGSRRSPIWVGGGVAHGPTPYTRRLRLNKKEKVLVFRWLLAQHIQKGVVLGLRIDQKDPLTTKQAVEFLRALKLLPFRGYFVTTIADENSVKGFRNLPKIEVRRAELLSVFDLYHKRFLLFTEHALDKLIDRLGTDEAV